MYLIAWAFTVCWMIAPFVVCIIVSTILMRKGSLHTGVKKPTVARAFWTSVATSLLVLILARVADYILRVVPISGLVLAPGLTSGVAREISSMVCGGILGSLLSLPIIKRAYKAQWGKAGKIWLYFAIVQVLILTVGYSLWIRAFPDINWIGG
jgi:hypothetical protein